MVKDIDCVSEVFVCTNNVDALEILAAVNPQVILLDIHLENESGLDIVGIIRTNYPSVKIIMVTNKASKYYRNLCNKMGSHGFIDKSEEFERIPAMIESYY